MPNKKQRMQNANNMRKLMRSLPPKKSCSNCGQPTHDGHFVPPSMGDAGFYICDPAAPIAVNLPGPGMATSIEGSP